MKNNDCILILADRYKDKKIPTNSVEMASDLNRAGQLDVADYVRSLDEVSYDDLIWDLESVQIEFEKQKLVLNGRGP